MRNKPFLSVGVLFMGVIVALGVMGIANGLWSKNLNINGVVETGDLNADWDCVYTNDDNALTDCSANGFTAGVAFNEAVGDNGLDPACGWPGFVCNASAPRKRVGECLLDGYGADHQTFNIELENVYPSYKCTITAVVSNTGTIPFNIIGSAFLLGAPCDGLVVEHVDCNGDALETDANCMGGVNGFQVDPGAHKATSCTIHVKETARQSVEPNVTVTPGCVFTNGGPNCITTAQPHGESMYFFAIKMCVAQWNEAATLLECENSTQHEGPGIPSVSNPAFDVNDSED